MYQFTKHESFCEILESVLFKIEVLILIKVSFLHTFESLNTFLSNFNFSKKKAFDGCKSQTCFIGDQNGAGVETYLHHISIPQI